MAKKNNPLIRVPSGVLAYAKTPGITSFSSLFSIKHALETDKVGHTGTLDSFAEGLLVVLTGHLTHLVPHITGFTKTYQAVVCFGKQTDTLDPTGEIIETGKKISKEELEAVLPEFTGALLQVPPQYSSLHVNGKRASELMREGKDVKLESRQIFVYENKLLDFKEADDCSYAVLEIKCSKGTYIRALARDIANRLGSVAFLSALRRTQVGPFKLEDAACYNELGNFTIDYGIENEKRFQSEKRNQENEIKPKRKDSIEKVMDIKNKYCLFNPEVAFKCGFTVDTLKADCEKSFLNGRPLYAKMFTPVDSPVESDSSEYSFPDEIAVFYENGDFAGMINKKERLSYSFVVPKQNLPGRTLLFDWLNVVEGKFPVEWIKKGTAVSIGNFDGLHLGHISLLDDVLDQKDLVSGIITFRESIKSRFPGYEGDVSSFSQKVEFCTGKGITFVVVIDFSDDFSKMKGQDFMDILVDRLGVKFLAEGKDFRCGYKGGFTMEDLALYSESKGFKLLKQQDIEVDGQKVSSSTIRKAVVSGDLTSAQKMISRPFCYDLRDSKLKEVPFQKKSENLWFETKAESGQLLPPDGNYEVVANLKSDSSNSQDDLNVLHSTLNLEKGKIKLLLPTQNIADRVLSVGFLGK